MAEQTVLTCVEAGAHPKDVLVWSTKQYLPKERSQRASAPYPVEVRQDKVLVVSKSYVLIGSASIHPRTGYSALSIEWTAWVECSLA